VNFNRTLSDEAVLAEMGSRLAQLRIGQNFTQADLATEAGVSTSTVARLESGAVAGNLSNFIRVARVLGVLERLELLLPENEIGPIAELEIERRAVAGRRHRVRKQTLPSGNSSLGNSSPGNSAAWTWGDSS
jgi:transcriptional regulator with XRE-family HTH domain